MNLINAGPFDRLRDRIEVETLRFWSTDARAVRPYFVQPAMRVGMWGGCSFYRPCAALRLLKTCLQIGLTLYEGSCARLAQKFIVSKVTSDK